MRTIRICATGFLMGCYLGAIAATHLLVNDEVIDTIRGR